MRKLGLAIIFLLVAGIMIFASGVKEGGSATNPGQAEEKIVKFKFVGVNQSGLLNEIEHKMAKMIKEKSNGTLLPEVFFEGQLGSNDEDLCSGLAEKNYQMLVNGDWFWTWHSPEWMGYFWMPFTFRDQKHLGAFVQGELGQMMNQRSIDKFGVNTYLKTIGFRGPRFITANKPIKNVTDMKGLKFRAANLPIMIASWASTGANVTPLPWGELFGGLQSGIVDSQENPVANIDAIAMYQVQKYMMMTYHQYLAWYVHWRNDWFNGLSARQQKAITDSVDEGFAEYNRRGNEDDENLMKKFVQKGMTIIPKSEINIESFRKTIVPTVLKAYTGKWAPGGWEKIQNIK